MTAQLRSARELILIAGVEGGGVTLYGQRTDTGWEFSSSYVDQTPLMLVEGDGYVENSPSTDVVNSWESALELLDRLGWLRLPAVMVHKEFGEQVWAAVQARIEGIPQNQKTLARWRDRCRIPR